MLRAAAGKGIPSLILEQNSYAGVTNKLLGRNADRICVAFPGMERFFPKNKIILTGNPVRQSITEAGNLSAEACYSFFGLNSAKKTLLVVGGSLGARTINESISQKLDELAVSGVQLIWQCGKGGYEKARQQFDANSYPDFRLYPFIKDMDKAYRVADLVISRAGAIAISELCLLGKPAILVPSPNVAEDHQTKNALALSSRNAALLVKDQEAPEKLVTESIRLMQNPEVCAEMAGKIREMASPHAVQKIADCVIEIMKKN